LRTCSEARSLIDECCEPRIRPNLDDRPPRGLRTEPRRSRNDPRIIQEGFMNAWGTALFCAALAAGARAQGYVYEQPMAPGGGTLRWSQLWIDPTGQNDLDSDAIAWEDFQLPQDTTITSVRWWGEVGPSLGFRISFYNQDPGTIAVQPDIFAPGSGPISQVVYPSVAQMPVGGGLYRFEVQLAQLLTFSANTRYFVSVVGRTPIAYATWGWAASSSGPNGTFWWQRGAHMYFHLGESRAMALATAAGWEIGTPYCFGDGSSGACPCANGGSSGTGCANSTGGGARLAAFGNAVVGADTVVLTARQCPPSAPGLFFGGPSAIAAASFGDGLRCVGGGVVRLGVVTTSASGVAQSTVPLSTREGLGGGELRHYQFWYRNVAGPCGQRFNTTNALSIQW
jgi:hypothetical protein